MGSLIECHALHNFMITLTVEIMCIFITILVFLTLAMVEVSDWKIGIGGILEELKTQVMLSYTAPMIVLAIISLRYHIHIALGPRIANYLNRDQFGSIEIHITQCQVILTKEHTILHTRISGATLFKKEGRCISASSW